MIVTFYSEIKDAAKDYSACIQASVRTIPYGISLVDDIAHLCDNIHRQLMTYIDQFVQEMQQITKRAHVDANQTYNQVCALRQKLSLVVIACVP